MRPLAALAVVAVALGAVALLHARAEAAITNTQAEDAPEPDSPADPWEGMSPQDVDVWGAIQASSDAAQTEDAMSRQSPNLAAFLSAIAASEGTDRAADPYRVCYGYRHTISSLADHPAITGEWRGESLARLGPSYAGKVSTAAGRYQIIRPTWLACKSALGLPDFSPASQDAAAVYLIRKRGALDDVEAGRVAEAIRKCRSEWASLPGAGAPGQPERRMDFVLAAYASAGGALA